MKDSKNLVIGMLCAVICIMAVAYAAFSTTLTINGTASIESNWCVRIKDAPTCTKTPVTGGAADSVTATLENIAARVDMLDSKVTKNEVTKNIDNLKETGDDMEEKFITKSDEQKEESIVENPEASVAEAAQFSENHYKTVKDFLSL